MRVIGRQSKRDPYRAAVHYACPRRPNFDQGHGPGHPEGPTKTQDRWYRLVLVNFGGAWKVSGRDSFSFSFSFSYGYGYGCGCGCGCGC